MIDAAESIESRLDDPFAVEPSAPYAFLSEKPSIREMLDRLILSKEVWPAALEGRDWPQERGMRTQVLRERFESSAEEWRRVVRTARDRSAWDDAFVDVTCDPPRSFTYGGMVAHVLTWSAHRRHVLIGALQTLGAGVGSGDPLEWEQPAATEN